MHLTVCYTGSPPCRRERHGAQSPLGTYGSVMLALPGQNAGGGHMDTQRAASQKATPQESPQQEPTPKTDSQLKRRGLIGAVAALVAGVLAKTTTETAEAQGTPLLM